MQTDSERPRNNLRIGVVSLPHLHWPKWASDTFSLSERSPCRSRAQKCQTSSPSRKKSFPCFFGTKNDQWILCRISGTGGAVDEVRADGQAVSGHEGLRNRRRHHRRTGERHRQTSSRELTSGSCVRSVCLCRSCQGLPAIRIAWTGHAHWTCIPFPAEEDFPCQFVRKWQTFMTRLSFTFSFWRFAAVAKASQPSKWHDHLPGEEDLLFQFATKRATLTKLEFQQCHFKVLIWKKEQGLPSLFCQDQTVFWRQFWGQGGPPWPKSWGQCTPVETS